MAAQDTGDPTVDFEGGRLVARCLDDDDLPDALAHDEGLLRFRVGVLAHVIEGAVDDQLDGLRTDLGLQLLDLLREIFLRRRLLETRFKATRRRLGMRSSMLPASSK